MGLDQVLLNEKDNPNMVPWSLRFQKYVLFGQTKHKTLNKFNDLILEFQYPFIHSGLQFTIAKDPPPLIQAQSGSTTHTSALVTSLCDAIYQIATFIATFAHLNSRGLKEHDAMKRNKKKKKKIETIKSANSHIN